MATAALMGSLDAKVDNLIKSSDYLNHAMYGTDGDKGVLPRIAVVESTLREAASSLQQTVLTLDRLATLVEAHHKDKSLHTPWGIFTSSWKPAAVALVAYVVLHVIITSVPGLATLALQLIGIHGIRLQ